ncbi:MAG: cytochrome P450 [Pseudomonadota bacterium]
MAEFIERVPERSYALPGGACQDLAHLPGPAGHWLFGNLRQLGANPEPLLTSLREQHGDCFTFGFLRNQRKLIMTGPEANELVLLDRDDNFSSHWGWEVVHSFFGHNILVRDFEDHRLHRKLMTQLFKPASLARYLGQMEGPIDRALATYVGPIDAYRQTKVMALEIAIRVFAGITSENVDAWNANLTTVLSNVMAPRIRLPGTRYWAALAARDRLRAMLEAEVAPRRGAAGDDLLTQLVNNTDQRGRTLCVQDVIDHMFGILFAAHDTTASSLAMLFWRFAKHPDLQERAIEECGQLYGRSGSPRLRYEDLDELPFIEACFKETLRLYAPIQFLPRRSLRAFSFNGHEIPANTAILLAPQVTHFDREFYPQPDRFLPSRFEGSTSAPFAFVPFGKGSHMCLGMRFAYMEIKAVMYRLFLSRRIRPADDANLDLEYLPIVRPKKAMQVVFET